MHVILLVEDEPFNRDVMEDIFEFDEIPAKLVSVESGEEALERVASVNPSLILMDVSLPGIDGLETTKRLKFDPQTKNIPVWAMTAHAMKGDDDKTKEVGCSRYFSKPLDAKHFVTEIREFLEQLNVTGV